MRKTYPNSKLKLWTRGLMADYSDFYDVVQIENTNQEDLFIVEVMEKAEKEKTPDIAELARQVVEGGK